MAKQPLEHLLNELYPQPDPASTGNRIAGQKPPLRELLEETGPMPWPAGWSPPTDAERRALLFAGRGGPAGLAIDNAGMIYGQIVKECRGEPPVTVTRRLLRDWHRAMDRVLSGPGGPPEPLPPENQTRQAWDTAALLTVKLGDQLARAWRAGGAWQEALEAQTRPAEEVR